jgi:hypothetical protein
MTDQPITPSNSRNNPPTINDIGSGNIIIPQQQESIEITRNSKGYGFVVKVLGLDIDKLKSITDRLDVLYPKEMK